MSILRVGIHGSWSIAVLSGGFLASPLDVLSALLVVVELSLAQSGDVPGERIVLHHVLGHPGPKYLTKVSTVCRFFIRSSFTSVS